MKTGQHPSASSSTLVENNNVFVHLWLCLYEADYVHEFLKLLRGTSLVTWGQQRGSVAALTHTSGGNQGLRSLNRVLSAQDAFGQPPAID